MARLARQFRDFDLAEEAVQSAVAEALASWRRDGPPDNPAAWLQTAARHNALDLVRRRTRQDALAHRAEAEPAAYDGRSATDDRLALLFACCHPALAPEVRLALTLRAVVGMTTPQIARAFLVNERTLAQRIVRAKRKIVTAGIALTVPADDVLTERLSDVLAVIALMYNEGFVSSDGPSQDRDLAGDAVWLAGVVATSLPKRGRGVGAGRAADASSTPGRPRASRTTARWCCCPTRTGRAGTTSAIAAGEAMLERAADLHAPGPSPAARRDRGLPRHRPSWAETDWLQIVALFEVLAAYDPSPVVGLNRAVAVSHLGPDYVARALADVDALADRLDGYHLFHATRAELLTRLGRDDEAAAANTRALGLTGNDAERRLLATRLHRHPLTDGS